MILVIHDQNHRPAPKNRDWCTGYGVRFWYFEEQVTLLDLPV